MPIDPPRTESAMETMDEHEDADKRFRSVVLEACGDRVVTDLELIKIEQASLEVVKTRRGLRQHLEELHVVVTACRSLLYTGRLTPKLQRRQRELMQGLEALRH